LRFSREKKLRFFTELLVLFSLGLAVATHATNVAAPSPTQHSAASVNPLCEYGCTTYYSSYYPGPYCGEIFSQTVYRAIVDYASADKQAYSPGDTITVSGKVEVQFYTYYYDSCECYNPNSWTPTNPATAAVVLELFVNSDWKSVSPPVPPDPSGTFVLTYQVPSDQPLGTLAFRVTASPSQIVYGNSCSPLLTPDSSLGHKTVQVSIQTIPPSITLTVTPMSGCAPFVPAMNYTILGGKAPFTVIVNYGDGTSADVSPGKTWPSHTYNSAGNFNVQITATDANGKIASDSKPIAVCMSPATTSSTPSSSTSTTSTIPPPLPPNGCDPTVTIIMIIITLIITAVIVRLVIRWIARRVPSRFLLILAIILAVLIWFFVGAVLILGPVGVCYAVITWIITILIIIVVIILFREWFIGAPPAPPFPPFTPPGRLPPNVTGNATHTDPNGKQTPLTNRTVSQVGPGSTVETSNHTFVRIQTPQVSNSQTTIGQDSRVCWLDPSIGAPIPWMRLPGAATIYNVERLILQLDFGKFLLDWVEPAVQREALIILPTGLISAIASAEITRWLARVKGTKVLVEAAQGGTGAAITVLEGDDPGKSGTVELWRSDDLKVIEVHAGERIILQTDRPPSKMSVSMAKGLTQQIEDPFSLLHRYWTLPPMSDETTAALTEVPTTTGGTTTEESYCTNCGRKIRNTVKFCPHCGEEQEHL
jgi:PKD repeat protein